MNLDGYNFTNFANLRVKGDGAAGPGALRFKSNSSGELTLQGNATYTDTDKTVTLPAKTGTIGVSGTFTVQLEAIVSGNYYETNVVVAGLRAEDGLVVSVQQQQGTVTTGRTLPILVGAAPGNGGAGLVFVNYSGTNTLAYAVTCGYTAVR